MATSMGSREDIKEINLMVVGAGGIGTHLLPMLIRASMSLPDNYVVTQLIIVDGDTYELRNLSRQQFTSVAIGRNKADVQVEKIKRLLEPVVDSSRLNHAIRSFPQYLTEENLSSCIGMFMHFGNLMIFSGVDNHPCRLLLSRFTERNKEANILLFTGGNNELDGSVHLQGKWNGVSFDKPVEERHPEIATDKTDDRGALSCQELQNLQGGEQTIAANAMAAAVMYSWFISVLTNPEASSDIEDFYYDIRSMNIRAIRPVKKLGS